MIGRVLAAAALALCWRAQPRGAQEQTRAGHRHGDPADGTQAGRAAARHRSEAHRPGPAAQGVRRGRARHRRAHHGARGGIRHRDSRRGRGYRDGPRGWEDSRSRAQRFVEHRHAAAAQEEIGARGSECHRTITSPRSARSPDELLVALADYAKNYKVDSPQAYETARYCLMDTLACGFQALKYPACTRLLGPVVPGATMPGGARVPGHELRARPGHGRVQHRRDGALARLQRHVAGRRVGPPVRQSRRHPRGLRLPVAPRDPAGREAAHRARRPDRDDQGARDPGRARAREFLQSRRPRSRAAGARRVDRGRHGDAGRLARADRQRAVERLDRRRRPAHLSPRAQHRLAQELGRRGRHEPRRAPRVVRPQGRDGLSLRADREDLGLSGRAVQGQAAHAGAAARQLRHGKRAVQDQLPRGVPRPDRGRMRDGAASAGEGPARARSNAS